MRRILNMFVLATLLFSCQDPEPEAQPVGFPDILTGTWYVEKVTLDAEARPEWSEFELSIALSDDESGTFSANNTPHYDEVEGYDQEDMKAWNEVWKDQSSWTLVAPDHLERSDETVIRFYDYSDSSIVFSFYPTNWPQCESEDPDHPCLAILRGHWWFEMLPRE